MGVILNIEAILAMGFYVTLTRRLHFLYFSALDTAFQAS